jgi:hypothetical protein
MSKITNRQAEMFEAIRLKFHNFCLHAAPSHSNQLLEMTNSLIENFTSDIMTQSLDPTILSGNSAPVAQPSHDMTNSYSKQQQLSRNNLTNFYNGKNEGVVGQWLQEIDQEWDKRTKYAAFFQSHSNVDSFSCPFLSFAKHLKFQTNRRINCAVAR